MMFHDAHDDGMDGIRARRNHLVAQWAAVRMGLDGDARKNYAPDLHRADHEEPGDTDVLRKLRADMTARGVEVSDVELNQIMRDCHRLALRETHSTD
jgi:hypothetical protein